MESIVKKLFIVFVGVIGLLFVLYKGAPALLHVLMGKPAIVVYVDMPVDEKMRQSIKQFCSDNFSPMSDVWTLALKKTFSLVDYVTSMREKDTVLITVHGVTFIALINKSHVIDSNGAVYPIDHINSDGLSDLKQLSMAKESEAFEDAFKIFNRTLPTYIRDFYTIRWQSPYSIYLAPLQAGCPCVIRYDVVPTKEQIAIGERLLQENKRLRNALVDFRFADQIIISTH